MEVAILGPVQVVSGGRVIVPGASKERAVLASLALHHGAAVSNDELVAAVWGERPPATATKTLRAHISRLRDAIGDDAIATDRFGYRLAVDADSVDAARLERLVADGMTAGERGDAETARRWLAEAESLWRGEPLADLGDGPIRWGQAARLRELWGRARDHRVDADLALGRHEAVIGDLEQMVADDPLREGAWGRLMLALYRSGRQVEALRAYRRLRELLAQDVGVEPSPKLQRLEWQILRQDPNLEVEVPLRTIELPEALSSFIGRDHDLVAVADELQRHRVVTLHGPAGVGKSRLALESSRGVADRFPDGVFWVDVTLAHDRAGVVAAVSEVLGVPSSSTPSLDALIDHVRRRDLLLVLDNCEHVRSAVVAVLRSLLQRAPEVRVLTTSRVVLGSAGELTYSVEPLSVPPVDADAAGALAAESVQLFQERRARQGVESADDRDVLQVASIVRKLEGLPLAVELAAARTRHLTPAEILDLFEGQTAILDLGSPVAGSPQHESIRATIEWSYGLLEPEAQHVLDRLAVFPGDFDLAAAQAVAASGETPDESVVAFIGQLVEAAMVVARPTGSGERFRFLTVVRQFASIRLAERGETFSASRSHTDHFRQFAVAAGAGIDAAEGARWWAATIRERHNIEAAVSWSLEHDDRPRSLQFARLLVRTWEQTVTGDATHVIDLFRQLLSGSDDAPPALRGWARLGLVTPAFLAGHVDLALASSEQAMSLFGTADDDAGTATALWMLGSALLLGLGDTDRARDHYARAATAAARCGLPNLEAWATEGLAQSELFEGRPLEPIGSLLERSESLADEALDELQAHHAMNCSYYWYLAGDLDACERAAQRCRVRAEAAGSSIYEQTALIGLAVVDLGRGATSDAKALALRAAQTALDAANTLQFGVSLMLLSAIAEVDGRAEPAALLWGAGTARAPAWPFIGERWFPANAQAALAEAFEATAAGGATLAPRELLDVAIG